MIAAAVVLYNPNPIVIENINSYINSVDFVLAIDNSETLSPEINNFITNHPKIEYINNHGNQGIAHALNVAANKAIKKNYTWLLTMDQDSHFTHEMISAYLQCWSRYEEKSSISIFSPLHNINHFPVHFSDSCIATDKLIVMTSGNLLNLNVFQKIGPFQEKLFIDSVDHEYCLRSKLAGYSIKEFSHISLNHNLGEPSVIFRHGQAIHLSTHTPKRFYYIVRNRLYMWKTFHHLFPDMAGLKMINIIKTLVFPLIYHEKKIQRFFYISKGILHFLMGRYGK